MPKTGKIVWSLKYGKVKSAGALKGDSLKVALEKGTNLPPLSSEGVGLVMTNRIK